MFFKHAGLDSQMNVSSHVNSSMQNLITLDTEIQVNLYTNSSYGCVSIANSLQNLGLRHALPRYLAGLNSSMKSLSTVNEKVLREHWFESMWRMQQWHDPLMSDFSDVFELSITNTPVKGFHESLNEALKHISKHDYASCNRFVNEGRKSIVSEIKDQLGGETFSSAVTAFNVQMQALNEIEELTEITAQKMFH